MYVLDNQPGSSEQEILKRIRAARHPEPQEPTDEVEAHASDDATADDSELLSEPENEEQSLDSGEIDMEDDSEVEASAGDHDEVQEESDELYVELDGEEIPLSEIREWKSGHMKEADYRRKTMALAEERKKLEAEREEFSTLKSNLQEKYAELEAAIKIEEEGIDWSELKEDDPERYIELKEKLEKRKQLASELKGKIATGDVDVQAEQQKLWSAHKEWIGKDGKPSEQFNKDMQAMNSYAQKHGLDQAELAKINKAYILDALIKAAKYEQLEAKGAEAKKKVRKAPVVTKPKKSGNAGLMAELEAAKKRLKQTGSEKDALHVRRLQKRLRGK